MSEKIWSCICWSCNVRKLIEDWFHEQKIRKVSSRKFKKVQEWLTLFLRLEPFCSFILLWILESKSRFKKKLSLWDLERYSTTELKVPHLNLVDIFKMPRTFRISLHPIRFHMKNLDFYEFSIKTFWWFQGVAFDILILFYQRTTP